MLFFKLLLSLSWRRLLLYRNQWFLYDNGLGHERVKMGKNEERYWVQHILWSSKILFCFWIDTYIFFANGHICNVVSTLPNVVKINVKKHNDVSTLFFVVNFNVELHNVFSTLIWRCVMPRRHINLKAMLNRGLNVSWVVKGTWAMKAA